MEMIKELELAKKAAISAGEFLRKRQAIKIDALEGKDLKLSSDRLSEKIIMDILAESGIPILSEECGFQCESTGPERADIKRAQKLCWIIDPLDGTVNYFKGMDELACVSIGLWREDRPVLGVVYRFMTEELYCGGEGIAACKNGIPIRPSDVRRTKDAVMAAGFPVKRAYDTDSLSQFVRQVQHFKKVRMLGAAAVMSTFVACGKIDAYFEDEIMLWDVAAGTAIVNAAGGSSVLELLQDYKVICKCFATKELMEDYYAKGL